MIATRKEGDVFIPGADKYTQDALAKGFVTEESIRTLCYHVPVILVPADNPGKVKNLDDLARKGLRVGLADAKAAAIGKVSMAILKKNNLTEPVLANCVVRPSTTNQLLIYTATGQVDAVIAWEDQALWGQAKGKVETVRIPTKRSVVKTIPAAVVSFSGQKELSQTLVDYISSEEGKSVWAEWGFPITKPE
jgi:molybdate transport system substrate-binding protein